MFCTCYAHNCCLKYPQKKFTDTAFKRKHIVCAEEDGKRTTVRKVDIKDSDIRRWRNYGGAIFLATTKCFRGIKKGRHSQVVLQFVIKGRSKELPMTRQIIIFKALEVF